MCVHTAASEDYLYFAVWPLPLPLSTRSRPKSVVQFRKKTRSVCTTLYIVFYVKTLASSSFQMDHESTCDGDAE